MILAQATIWRKPAKKQGFRQSAQISR